MYIKYLSDVGRIFLAMIDRHFPKGTPLGKIFNRNTIRLSYRTGRNLKRHIDGHNRALLQKKPEDRKACNCRGICDFQGRCRESGVIYSGNVVDDNNNAMKYWGQTKNEVKKRVEQHRYSFSTPKKTLNRKGTLISIEQQIEEKKRDISIKYNT